MFTSGQFDVERFRYWQGQMLRSRDLRGQLAVEAELRWWHNRALHSAYGVRSGFAVTAVEHGNSVVGVEVDCGVAYDCYGRELVLQTRRELPLPQIGEGPIIRATLIARYKEFRRGAHTSCGCRPLEEPDFIWVIGRNIDSALGVPLARLSYNHSHQVPFLDKSFFPPVSRPFARPRVASGATVPGDTHWETWVENITLFGKRVLSLPVGMQVTVDTSAAGFTETPCYFAWLQGTLWDKSNVEFFPVPLTHLEREQTNQFRFRLWLPRIEMVLGARLRTANSNFDAEFINYAREHGLHVCWIGIQHGSMPVGDCVDPEPLECQTTGSV